MARKPKAVYDQEGRENSMARARRDIVQTHAIVNGLRGMADGQLDDLNRTNRIFYGRTLAPIYDALGRAWVLTRAYDYFLARCQEAGIALAVAEATWQTWATPTWEAELLDDASHFLLIPMVDAQLLSHLGIPPQPEEIEVDEPEEEEEA